MRQCRNQQCEDNVHTPDHRTGLIHTNNKYACRTKNRGQHTVAE